MRPERAAIRETDRAAARAYMDPLGRERAGVLRDLVTWSGLLLIVSGLVSLVGVVAPDHAVGAIVALILVVAGAGTAWRAWRATRMSTNESIATDFAVVGVAFSLGGLGELMHAIIAPAGSNAFHLLLAAGVGLAGSILLTCWLGGSR